MKLAPGDRCYFIQNGRKLRGVVADNLALKARGEPRLIPFIRPRNAGKAHLDRHGAARRQKLRWLERKQLRKLP